MALPGPGGAVAGAVTYDSATTTADDHPERRVGQLDDLHGNRQRCTGRGRQHDDPVTWSFTTAAPPPPPPDQGPGGPVLVIRTRRPGQPVHAYSAEILRTEGLNEFATADCRPSRPPAQPYDIVVLGRRRCTAAQVTTFTNWVTAGGNLIAMRPDKQLAGLLGLTESPAARCRTATSWSTPPGARRGHRRSDDPVPRHGRPLHAERRARSAPRCTPTPRTQPPTRP